jgi:hypothetical protein
VEGPQCRLPQSQVSTVNLAHVFCSFLFRPNIGFIALGGFAIIRWSRVESCLAVTASKPFVTNSLRRTPLFTSLTTKHTAFRSLYTKQSQ